MFLLSIHEKITNIETTTLGTEIMWGHDRWEWECDVERVVGCDREQVSSERGGYGKRSDRRFADQERHVGGFDSKGVKNHRDESQDSVS